MKAQFQSDQAPNLGTPQSASDAPSQALPASHLAVLPDPQVAKRTRNGKVARLPHLERDMVNRMLRDNIPNAKIRGALEEHGFSVTERNISNWKTRGGYREWCAEQDRALENHLLQDNLLEHLRKHDATGLPEIGLQLAATSLSQFFLKPETRKNLASDPEKFARAISTLCRLSRHIHTLQKYRDDSAKELGLRFHPERLQRDAEKHVEGTREIYSASDLGERPGDPITPRRNYIPKEGYTSIEPSR